MEVHAHSHTPRKKWTHYFWEFLMLFLAVFCGFLAEYQLEHKIEKDRARELAKSFYDELENDSIAVLQAIQFRQRKDTAIIFLADYFQDSSLKNFPKIFGVQYTLALMVNSPMVFEPRTAILEQLKNSGSLRYFKSKELQLLTGSISVAIANLKARHEIEQDYYKDNIFPFLIRHNDYDWHKKIRGSDQSILLKDIEVYANSSLHFPYHLSNSEAFNKTEAINTLQIYQVIIQTTQINQYKKYMLVNQELLEELRNQYHIK